MEKRRYPLAPLAVVMGESVGNLAKLLGIGGPEYQRYKTDGMLRETAERKALKAGFHPYEVWPEMADHDLYDSQKECAAEDCDVRFVPAFRQSTRQRFCSTACKARDWQRRNYERNAEKKRAAVREYDQANRDLKRRAIKNYRRLNRDRINRTRRAYYERNREAILQKRRDDYWSRKSA